MQWKYIAKGYQKHPTRCKHQQWFFNPFAKKMTNRKTWPSTWTSKQNIWCQHTLPKYPKVKHGPWKATFPYLPNKRKVLFQLPTIMGGYINFGGRIWFFKTHTHTTSLTTTQPRSTSQSSHWIEGIPVQRYQEQFRNANELNEDKKNCLWRSLDIQTPPKKVFDPPKYT